MKRRHVGRAVDEKVAPPKRLTHPLLSDYVDPGETDDITRAVAFAEERWREALDEWLDEFQRGWGDDFDRTGEFTPSLHAVVPEELHEWIPWARQAQVMSRPRIVVDL